ncbi:MAG: glycosyltransferase family 39 protein [Caldilineaceae bacterium]|nr:glycosyltransferase family 39 protein [Caldilineaceae bacterium]
MICLPPTPSIKPALAHKRLLALAGIFVAFALRLHHLGAESLWYDETVSAFLARQTIPELLSHTARDIHPPAYYLLLHGWALLAQPSLERGLEFLYAWPSLFWGVLLLPLIYALGRRFFAGRVAVIALWLAGVSPYHIWYSQEVRMYTLAAFLGLLCLWGVVDWWQQSGQQPLARAGQRGLLVYTLAAAAGLYTLYYFAFLLIALNLLVLGWAVRRPAARYQNLTAWLAANFVAFLLWSPWLPIFWRQMIDPPVPPWRGELSIATVAGESLASLLVGQSPPLGLLWPWAAAAGILLLFLIVTVRRGGISSGFSSEVNTGVWTLLVFVFTPLLLIAGISLTITPLYHIRYFYTYAAVSVLLLAVAFDCLILRFRWLHAILLLGIFALNGWGLAEFWTNPLYRADDHRAAVAELAAAWRPGDAILVNAGWVYTALAVYWPPAPAREGATTPSLPIFARLGDYTNKPVSQKNSEEPLVLLGGSVDGSPTLGWGLAESDFYAISAAATRDRLTRLAEGSNRLWQYRLYDTVSDPQAVVRQWLGSHTAPLLDLPYPGRDYLRVQLFEMPVAATDDNCPRPESGPVRFGDAITLRSATHSPAPTAGSTLYATLCWEIQPGAVVNDLRTSLRLYRQTEGGPALLNQKDESLLFYMATRSKQQATLALPIPASIPAGIYQLELIVYDGTTGAPLPIPDERAIVGQRWPLDLALPIKQPQ